MRVRTFKPRFAALVKSGRKRQTIRPMPKRYPKVGEHESWRQWNGRPYNSGQTELAQIKLTEVQSVVVHRDGIEFSPGTLRVCFFGEWHKERRKVLEAIAILDGFSSWIEMRDWFQNKYTLPFSGVLISGKDL